MTFDLTQNPTTDASMLLRFRDRQYSADMLAVAIGKLNLFTWIDEQKTVTTRELREEFKLAARPLDVLLTLCRASGLIKSEASASEASASKASDDDSQQHQLTALGKEHLVDSSPWFLGPYYAPIVDSAIAAGCLQVLQADRPANWQGKEEEKDWHESMMDDEFAQGFTQLMNCRGTAMGQALADAVGPLVAGCSHVLDVGGGSGIYSTTLVAKHPHLSATVFEQPPVEAITRKEIARHQLSDRVGVVSGNMFTDPWPTNADCVLLSNVLHDWDFPEIRKLVEKTAAALPTGGLLIVHEAFLNDEKTGPLPVAEYSVLLANITQGKCYSPKEYGDILTEYGFEVGPYKDTVSDRGFFTAVKK